MSYYEEARSRARQRKSAWNGLLIPAVVGPGALLFWLLHRGAAFRHPRSRDRRHPRERRSALVVIPIALYLANLIVWLIPPVRRVLDAEAAGYPGTDFRSSQGQLLLVMRYVVPPAVALTILGTLLPWYC